MDINVNRYTIEDVLKVLIYPLFTSLAILAFFLFFFYSGNLIIQHEVCIL